MRIAVLAPYAPPVPGGISTFVSGLHRTLEQAGHTVSTFVGEGAGDETHHSNLGAGREFVRKVGKGLEEVRPEVIHCHSHWYALAGGIRYLRKHPGARLIFSFHTTAAPRPAFARLLSRSQVLTFVSIAQLAHLRDSLRLGGDNRILRPATEIVEVSSDEAERCANLYHLDGAFPVIMFAGPLEYPGKVAGVLDLIRVFRNLRRDYPDAKLLILGGGTLQSQVEAASRGLNDSVTITGFIQDPRAALANADLYCHISRQEGLPTALLEAMSLGRCVVASRVGGIPEVLDGSNGLLVQLETGDLDSAIRSLLDDTSRRRRLGEAAFRTIERSYTWAARLPDIYSVYGLAE